MKKGFTLAEIIIVLMVIGILTAILLPAARHITPDENIIKFKKGHNALLNAVRETVMSDNYYLDGDMGVKANGIEIDGTHTDDNKYMCLALADVLSVKSVNCQDKNVTAIWQYWTFSGYTLEKNQENADTGCKGVQSEMGAEIITSNDIIFFQTAPKQPMGIKHTTQPTWRVFNAKNGVPSRTGFDENGFPMTYKTYCMDIDGIGTGEDPFGYGIRADGRVLAGKRATEWLSKSINEK